MAVYEMVEATQELASELALTMREADRDEVWAAARKTPAQALESSLMMSRDSMAGLVNGRVACMFGVGQCSALGLVGIPWLLASEEMVQHARRFLRGSRNYIDIMKQRYISMQNYVDARNVEALKWLVWLGFEIEPAEPFGIGHLPFHRFHWARENNNV